MEGSKKDAEGSRKDAEGSKKDAEGSKKDAEGSKKAVCKMRSCLHAKGMQIKSVNKSKLYLIFFKVIKKKLKLK